jgi:hypothetical protein
VIYFERPLPEVQVTVRQEKSLLYLRGCMEEYRQVEPLFMLATLLALVACASRLVPSVAQVEAPGSTPTPTLVATTMPTVLPSRTHARAPTATPQPTGTAADLTPEGGAPKGRPSWTPTLTPTRVEPTRSSGSSFATLSPSPLPDDEGARKSTIGSFASALLPMEDQIKE